MKHIIEIFFSCLLFVCLNSSVFAQITIKGVVRLQSGNPISGVSVVHHSGGISSASAETDSTGFFKLTIQNNSGNIIFTYKGFETFIFKPELLDSDTLLTVTLTPTPPIYPFFVVTGLSEQRSQNEIPFRSTILFSNKTDNPLQFSFSRNFIFSKAPSVLFRQTHAETNQQLVSVHGLPSRYTSILENGIPTETSVGFPLSMDHSGLLGYEQVEFINGNSINPNSSSATGILNFIPKTFSYQPVFQIQSYYDNRTAGNISLFSSSPASFGGWNVLGSLSKQNISPSSEFSETLFLKSTFFLDGEYSRFSITPTILMNRESTNNRVSLLGLSSQTTIGDLSSDYSTISTSVNSSVISNHRNQSYNRIFVFTEMKWNGYDEMARYIAGISAQNISITGTENLPQHINFGYPQISLFLQMDNNLNDNLFWLGSFRWTAVNSLAPLFTFNAAIQNITDIFSFGLSGQFSMIPVSLYEPEFSAFDLSRFQSGAEKLYSETLLGFSVFSQNTFKKNDYEFILKLSFDYFYLTNPVYADHILNASPLGDVISEEWKLFQRDLYQDFPSLSEHMEFKVSAFEIHHDFIYHFLKDDRSEFPILYLPNKILNHTFIYPINNLIMKVSHSWKGNQWIPDSFGFVKTPSYSILNAEISYSLQHFTFFLIGLNLTDAQASPDLSSHYFYKSTAIEKNNRMWSANQSRSIQLGLNFLF